MTRAQLSSPPFTGSWDLSASQMPGRVDGLYVRVDVLRRVSGFPGVPPPRITLVHLTEKSLACRLDIDIEVARRDAEIKAVVVFRDTAALEISEERLDAEVGGLRSAGCQDHK